MGDYRSRSYADGRMQTESSYGYAPNRPTSSNPRDFRSYSYSDSYGPPYAAGPPPLPPAMQMGVVNDWELEKDKNKSGSSFKSWSFNDPEFQRKKRVASYRVYTVEGKVKGSLRKSFRWLKDKYTQVVNGWW